MRDAVGPEDRPRATPRLGVVRTWLADLVLAVVERVDGAQGESVEIARLLERATREARAGRWRRAQGPTNRAAELYALALADRRLARVPKRVDPLVLEVFFGRVNAYMSTLERRHPDLQAYDFRAVRRARRRARREQPSKTFRQELRECDRSLERELRACQRRSALPGRRVEPRARSRRPRARQMRSSARSGDSGPPGGSEPATTRGAA